MSETQVSQETPKQQGIQLLLNKAVQPYNKLPMLEIICEKFVRLLSNSLRNYTSDMVDASLKALKTECFGEYMNNSKDGIICVFKAEALNHTSVIFIENKLIYSFVDILFGGRKVSTQSNVEGKAFTSIEMNVIKSVTELVLEDFSTAFEQIIRVNFELDRVETNHKFAMIMPPEDAMVVLELEVILDNRGGKLEVTIPYSTLDPIKKLLMRSYVNNRTQQDPVWSKYLENEIADSNLDVQIMITSTEPSVEEVANMEVGKTIVLDKIATSDWDVIIAQNKVASAKLGKLGEKLAVTITSNGIKTTSSAVGTKL